MHVPVVRDAEEFLHSCALEKMDGKLRILPISNTIGQFLNHHLVPNKSVAIIFWAKGWISKVEEQVQWMSYQYKRMAKPAYRL
ncbi:hypothetical protein SLA2020_527850 [Shorea laevis]